MNTEKNGKIQTTVSNELAAEACDIFANWIETRNIEFSGMDIEYMDASVRRQLRLRKQPLSFAETVKVEHLRHLAVKFRAGEQP